MNYTEINIDNIKVWLKENLNEERYSHSLGTAECACKLADKYNLDNKKAYLAGLLHDTAKCFKTDKLLDIINREGFELEEGEIDNYKTLHAPASAIVAQKEFGINDVEILSAIRWHTIGKLGMSLFDKIIFLADKIEPNTRDKAASEILWKMLDEENGLDKAILECYKYTIKSLVDRNLKICIKTIEIYNSLQKNLVK